jgi:beta-galactosidase
LWVEEVDRLAPGTPRKIAGLPGQGGDVAALLHLTGAEAVATFAEDFYEGQPAVTKHLFGKGTAYFIATRLDEHATDALYAPIIDAAGLRRVIDGPLPPGVTAQLRGAGDDAFVFLLNFSAGAKTVPLGKTVLIDAEDGTRHAGHVELAAAGSRVFRVEGNAR